MEKSQIHIHKAECLYLPLSFRVFSTEIECYFYMSVVKYIFFATQITAIFFLFLLLFYITYNLCLSLVSALFLGVL